MKIIRFSKEHFAAHQKWFEDSYLNKELGPMDNEWLEAVLAGESHFCAFDNDTLVAVIGVEYPDSLHNYYVITDIAVNPELQNQGIGTRALNQLINKLSTEGQSTWKAYINLSNHTALAFFKKNGWQENDDILEGMIEMSLHV